MTSDDYLRRVGSALRDLPWRQRQELLAELRGHLADFPADTDLSERLGTPEQYAADLRAAEGLERRRGPVAYVRARRPRNVIVAAIALALALTAIGLGIAAVVWVDGYQPLQDAGFGFAPADATPSLGKDGYTAFFRDGRPFEYGLGIDNDGRYGVRILGAQRPWVNAFALRLMLSKDDRCQSLTPLVPFRSFDLQPHACRFLIWKGVYACHKTVWPKNDSFGLGDFTVRYSFLWRTANVTIPLMDPLEISFRKEGRGCSGTAKP